MNTNGIGNHLALSSLQEASSPQKPAIPAGGIAAANDQASLSHVSTSLAQALTTSDARMDKVAALQQAIASGSYHVPSSAVADKIVTSLTE